MIMQKEKQIKTIALWFNSYLSFESTVILDAEKNLVYYKSNFYEYSNSNYESMYLRDKRIVDHFLDYSSVGLTWESKYGPGVCIDGYYWKLSITFSDDSSFESEGRNGKPQGFDEFVCKFEKLLGKPIAYNWISPEETKIFARTLLLIPNRPDPERDAVAAAWERAGGDVLRVDKFWEPVEHEERNIKIYGDAAFSMVLGSIKNYNLIEPDFHLPITLDPKWLNRKIDLTKLEDIQELEYPIFVKPVIPKQFRSRIYNSAEELEYECRGLYKYTSILFSEIVTFENEIRCFVLDDQVMAMSIYEGEADMDDAREFAISFAAETKNRRLLVKTYVVDIGYIRDRGWAVIEVNPVWGSGLNGCDAEKVIDCIYYATKPQRGIHDVDLSMEEVEEILIDGSYADMSKLKGYSIRYDYDRYSSSLGDMMNLVVGGKLSHSDGFHYPPNCLKYFGYSHDFIDDYT